MVLLAQTYSRQRHPGHRCPRCSQSLREPAPRWRSRTGRRKSPCRTGGAGDSPSPGRRSSGCPRNWAPPSAGFSRRGRQVCNLQGGHVLLSGPDCHGVSPAQLTSPSRRCRVLAGGAIAAGAGMFSAASSSLSVSVSAALATTASVSQSVSQSARDSRSAGREGHEDGDGINNNSRSELRPRLASNLYK